MLLLTALIMFNAAAIEEISPLQAKPLVEVSASVDFGPTSSKKTGVQAHRKLQRQYRYIDKSRPWIFRWIK